MEILFDWKKWYQSLPRDNADNKIFLVESFDDILFSLIVIMQGEKFIEGFRLKHLESGLMQEVVGKILDGFIGLSLRKRLSGF